MGAANTVFNDWISTDIEILDIIDSNNWMFLFKKESLCAVLAEHVWEHFDDVQAKKALKNIYVYLKRGGYLRIAVPDGFHPDPSYIELVKPGGSGLGSDTHKQLYNYKSLSKLLVDVGFQVELLEYWDEDGRFHHKKWKEEDGLIIRSMENDKRNKEKPLSYTSLIIDAAK